MKDDPHAPALILFRHDLRLSDNLALCTAAHSGLPLVAVYIEDLTEGVRPLGAAARWWRARSLRKLQNALSGSGLRLICRRGPLCDVVGSLIAQIGAGAVFMNRRFEPAADAADVRLIEQLARTNVVAERHEGQLLHDPHQLRTTSGGFYKVFTPFWRALASQGDFADPADAPDHVQAHEHDLETDPDGLLDYAPAWATAFGEIWEPGESGAQVRLNEFLEGRGNGYTNGRDRMAEEATSRLSPHLAHGEITPRQIMAALGDAEIPANDLETFRREIGWREFCWHLLANNKDLAQANFNKSFDSFPWRDDAMALKNWQEGRTGYPLVDAAMRQLWETGWMHNRARMVVASFLVKHLGLHWREGERWFWDTLVDADAANNPANWQWVAGTGADAAPFFRVFNPTLQSRKFDQNGDYIRSYVPELSEISGKQIHDPSAELRGKTGYPRPIVEHTQARDSALAAYRSIR